MVTISVIYYTLMCNPHVKSYANSPLPQFFGCPSKSLKKPLLRQKDDNIPQVR